MKHRSVIAFILLAAALVAAPQISHDLASFKRALSARIHGELLHALLNLRANESGNSVAPNRAEPQLASCKTQESAPAQIPSATKKTGRSTARAEALKAQSDAVDELAMLDAPSTAHVAGMPKTELKGDPFGVDIGEASEIAQGQIARGELAMLVPPGTGLDAPGLADNRFNDARARTEARRQKNAGAQRHVVYVAADFEKAGLPQTSGEVLRRLGSTWTEANLLRTAESGLRVKVLKLKRTGRAAGEDDDEFATKPAPVAALTSPEYAPPAAPRAAGEE